jgi:beta-galactosidase
MSNIKFNNDWKFLLGDDKNAKNPDFCDRTWKRVDLPHDWVINMPFYRETEKYSPRCMQGYFVFEEACWYRKDFELSGIEGKSVYIYFGGAYRNSTVYVNGKEAGSRASGYSSFELDITDFVKEGKNLIAVRLDHGCEEPDRWYSGAGLYRNVFLKVLRKTHLKTWGVHIDTKLADNRGQSEISAEVTVNAAIVSRDKTAKGNICVRVFAKDDRCIEEKSAVFEMDGKNEISVRQQLSIKNPALWSAEKPNLYRALVYLEIDGEEEEPVTVNFGIRTIEIAYNSGMTVNGQKIKLKGVCLHHDAGITGSAYYDEVWRRRLGILKSIGANAVRTSHNPPAEEFLDLCDELGFYVIDECFDKWKSGYYGSHFEKDSHTDLTDFILRDKNHPCIFMWSVGNEVENQGADSMLEIQKSLITTVKSLDSRPVTCALAPHANPRSLAWAPVEELVKITKKLAKDVDVLGLNYHEPLYEAYTKAIEKPIVGTECYEYYSCSGTNFEDVTEKNPWQFVLENDNVIGQFIWAGIDYLGEASWPAKGWPGSILDICCFMKPNAFFRKSLWSSEPFVYLAIYDQSIKPDYARGRWSFPSMASHLNFDHLNRRTVKAAIFTNCEEAELWINSKKMERRKKADYENGIIQWVFEYTSGNIKVNGINKGKEVCSYNLNTADKAEKISLKPDKQELEPGEIAHIELDIVDKDGVLCATEDHFIEFAITGDAQFLGCCSSDLNQNLGYTVPKVLTSGGRALAIIRAGASCGSIKVSAYSEKFESSSVLFKVR